MVSGNRQKLRTLTTGNSADSNKRQQCGHSQWVIMRLERSERSVYEVDEDKCGTFPGRWPGHGAGRGMAGQDKAGWRETRHARIRRGGTGHGRLGYRGAGRGTAGGETGRGGAGWTLVGGRCSNTACWALGPP